MTTYRVPLADLPARIAKDMRARKKRIVRAVHRTAQMGAKVVRENVPVAFHELEHSVHPVMLGDAGAKIVADAPHAAAVEVGSRPHWPPLEPILLWVKLRGMQGLQSDKQLAKLPGTTTARHARAVAGQIAAMRVGGRTPVDAPMQIAQAIRASIGRNGTKPHFYMLKSLPAITEILKAEIEAAMPDKESDAKE